MSVDVLLVTMPWSSLLFPSIQLGTLKSVLTRAGHAVHVEYANLRFAQHAIEASASVALDDRITVDDLHAIAESPKLGDWIFAVPPFRDHDDAADRGFWELMKKRSQLQAKATHLRQMVPGFLARCVEQIVGADARVVGFTTSFGQNVASLALAKLLAQRIPETPIIFGGANCDGPMGAALHRLFPWVDVVVRGEAERVIVPLIDDLVAKRPVRDLPGICVRRAGASVAIPAGRDQVSMSEVPEPDYDEYFELLATSRLELEVLPKVRILYESARGCWWGEKNHCTFCGLNGSSMVFRSKPADQTYDEMIALGRRYRSLHFQVVDNIIELNYLRELLPRLRDTGWDWDVFYETKANLKKEQLWLFRESGVRTIQPGIESLSTPILKLMKKGVTALQNIRLLKWCAELGIDVAWNLIYGFPGEDPAEYARMAAVMPALVHLKAPNATCLNLERFSPYHQDPGRYGLEITGPAATYPLLYPAAAADLEELAYSFEYRYLDGRTPSSYVAPVLEAIDAWNAATRAGSLFYEHGPGFLVIDDHRSSVEAARYTFDEEEARIYLACDAGATPSQVAEALRASGHGESSADEVREFLDGLVEARLVYEERGRYLALAIARDPRRAHDGRAVPDEEPASPATKDRLIQLRTSSG